MICENYLCIEFIWGEGSGVCGRGWDKSAFPSGQLRLTPHFDERHGILHDELQHSVRTHLRTENDVTGGDDTQEKWREVSTGLRRSSSSCQKVLPFSATLFLFHSNSHSQSTNKTPQRKEKKAKQPNDGRVPET